MSSRLHSPISTLSLSDTFATLYGRVNETIAVVNQIRIYDLRTRGGIVHSREVGVSGPVENIRLNLPVTGGTFGYGLNLITLSSSASSFVDGEAGTIANFEGMTQGVRVDFSSLQPGTTFTENSATVYVSANDLIAVAATGSRGDGVWRLRSVSATNSLPYTIAGDHRFSGDIFFDGSKVVVNSSQFHLDDRLIFIASAGNTDDPSATSGLTSNFGLAGGSGSGLVIKGASGDKFMVYFNSEGTGDYFAFRFSDHIQTDKSYISPKGQFNFVGTSGSAPSISLRTKGQDSATVQTGWKIFQSVTGAAAGSLQVKREGISDVNTLELFSNGEVKVGTLSTGTGGQGSFRTYPAAFAVPAVGAGGVLHYGWQNRDVVQFTTNTNGGLFGEPISYFKPGTALVFNGNGHYIRGQWDTNPNTGYKEAEVVGILEKTTSDYVLQIPVVGSGTAYTLNEAVRIQSWNGNFLSGYVWETPPANGLSGVKVIIDDFTTAITAGTITGGSPFYTSGATLYGSFDNAALGICGSIGITVTEQKWAVIVRGGAFEIPETSIAATGYQILNDNGLSAGYIMYLHKDGGITYAKDNNFSSEEFYQKNATVAKPLFVYLGNINGQRMGLYQNYQGLGITQAISYSDIQPVYYNPSTNELSDFDLLGDVGGKNKIINSGFDLWTRLDTMGATYAGAEGSKRSGITFGSTTITEYPFGVTYEFNNISSSYIADGFFLDASNARNKMVEVVRSPISSFSGELERCSNPPENELVITSRDTESKPVRLYAVVPNYHTLGKHDFNFSFYGRASNNPTGVTVGVAYVWAGGVTHAKIENYHLSLVSGEVGFSGGTTYGMNLTTTYTRYSFPFSSESLNLNTQGYKDSFVAPYIEFGTDMGQGESLSTTGWQLTKGMTVKPYVKKSYAEEKGDCDRYFQNVVLAHGGYYPLSTGNSGPELFVAANLPVTMAEIPKIAQVVDTTIQGIVSGTTSDVKNVRKNYISVFRKTNTTSPIYHRYFETVYCLDASGFSGSVQSRLSGMA